MQQLSIFDALAIQKEFEVNDVVEVVASADQSDVETYFYLREFTGMKGRVIKIIQVPDLQYEVQYNKKERVGIFRHEELKGLIRNG